MCYVRTSAGDRRECAREISARAWVDLARTARERGMTFLLLTGGEILLRSDFLAIYEPLTRLGLVLTLFTNGTLITEEIADRLAAAPPSTVAITLYGASPATYAAVTGSPDGFDRCCRGIRLLAERNVPLCLKTTLTSQNHCDLEAMRRMARDWGLPLKAGLLLTRRSDGAPSEVDTCRLSAEQCMAIEAADTKAAAEWDAIATAEPGRGERPIENFYCPAGRSAFAIDPSGAMGVCLDLPHPAARPIEVGFDGAWRRVQEYVDGVPPLSGHCRGCDARVFCSRCPAWSWMETRTLDHPVPYLCAIARARRSIHAPAR